MMKKLNSILLNAKLQDMQQAVSNAIFIEKLELDGVKPEDLGKEAKRLLGLAEDSSLIAEAEDAVKKLDLEMVALLNIHGNISKLSSTGSLEEGDLESLRAVEKKLAEKVMKRYNLTEDQIYIYIRR